MIMKKRSVPLDFSDRKFVNPVKKFKQSVHNRSSSSMSPSPLLFSSSAAAVANTRNASAAAAESAAVQVDDDPVSSSSSLLFSSSSVVTATGNAAAAAESAAVQIDDDPVSSSSSLLFSSSPVVTATGNAAAAAESSAVQIDGDMVLSSSSLLFSSSTSVDLFGSAVTATGNAAVSAVLMDENLLFEVLKHVDARTLGAAACVSRRWHRTAQDERLWELICTNNWPANIGIGNDQLRVVVLALGGFRCLHSHYLLPLSKPPVSTATSSSSSTVAAAATTSSSVWPCLPLPPRAVVPTKPNNAKTRWGRDEIQLSLSLLSIRYFEKLNYNNRNK